jgi:hypothetical protein
MPITASRLLLIRLPPDLSLGYDARSPVPTGFRSGALNPSNISSAIHELCSQPAER